MSIGGFLKFYYVPYTPNQRHIAEALRISGLNDKLEAMTRENMLSKGYWGRRIDDINNRLERDIVVDEVLRAFILKNRILSYPL